MSNLLVQNIKHTNNTTAATVNSSGGVAVAGTLAVTGVHTVGNNAVYTSDGGAVTQSLVQGVAKSWTHFNGSSFAGRDDFNTSSLTDAGTGNYTFAITNNMGNANYTLTTNGTRANDQHVGCYFSDNSTSQAKFFTMDFTSNSYEDTDTVMGVIHGDLA